MALPYPIFTNGNSNTLPSIAVNVSAEAVTIELPNNAFYRRPFVGGFFLDLRQAIPTGTTATLPILIGTNGDTRPLLTYNNEAVTVANISGTGVYLIHYNKYTNELRLVGLPAIATT